MANHKKIASILLTSLVCSSAVNYSAIAQADIFYNNKDVKSTGVTSLMSAAIDNDVDGVRFFIKSESATINQKNLGGATALHLACRNRNPDVVKILLENGADVNAVDAEGWTPLMRASLASDSNIVALLLDSGADVNTLNNFKDSAIVHAAVSDCNQCLSVIFEKSTIVKTSDVEGLKQQIHDAFVIARNHDNRDAQTLLSNMLDNIIRLSSAVGEEKVVVDQNQPTTKSGELTTANLVPSDKVTKEPTVDVSLNDKPVDVVEENKEVVVPDNNQKTASKIEVLTSPQKNDEVVVDEKTLTEEDITPAVVTKIDTKELQQTNNPLKSAAPKKIKFKFNQGPMIAKPDLTISEPPVVATNAEETPATTIVEEEKKKSIFSSFFDLFRSKKGVEIVNEEVPVVSEANKTTTTVEEPKEEKAEKLQEIKTEESIKKELLPVNQTKKFKLKQGPVGRIDDNSAISEPKKLEVDSTAKEEKEGFFSRLFGTTNPVSKDQPINTEETEVDSAAKEVEFTTPENNESISVEEEKKPGFFSRLFGGLFSNKDSVLDEQPAQVVEEVKPVEKTKKFKLSVGQSGAVNTKSKKQ
ncbi:MAG: ankyrin repeat domain-containing protein [Rickettsiales bacterium]|nr:ankyrin repeat domain-containing protein [Rickettsiales bacterium]